MKDDVDEGPMNLDGDDDEPLTYFLHIEAGLLSVKSFLQMQGSYQKSWILLGVSVDICAEITCSW